MSTFTSEHYAELLRRFRLDLMALGIKPANLRPEQLQSLGAKGLKGMTLPSKKHVTGRR